MKFSLTIWAIIIVFQIKSQINVPVFETTENFSSCASYNHLIIFNHNSKEYTKLENPHSREINDLLFVKNHLYSAGSDGRIIKYDTNSRILTSYGKTHSSINALNHQGDTLMGFTGDGYMYRWNINNYKLIDSRKISNCGIISSNVSDSILMTSDFCGNIKLTNLRSNSSRNIIKSKNKFFDILKLDNGYYITISPISSTKGYQLLLTTFNIEGKVKNKLYVDLWEELDFYNTTPLTLGLKFYQESKNEFYLHNPTKIYSVNEKGKILIRNRKFEEQWVEYEDGIHYYTLDSNITFSENSFINHLDGQYYSTFEKLKSNVSLIESFLIPSGIISQLETFMEGSQSIDTDVTPVIQNSFSRITDAICDSDTNNIVVINESKEIKIYNTNTKKLVGNILSDVKVIRLAMHPFAPIFAAMQIDGTAKIYHLENLMLLGEYQFYDNKLFKKNSRYGFENVLGEYVKFQHYGGGPYLTFKFNQNGNYLISLTPENSFFNQFTNYNVIDILSNERYYLNLNLDDYDYTHNLWSNVKGYFADLNVSDPTSTNIDNAILHPRNTELNSYNLTPLASKYFSLASNNNYTSPAVHLHNDGNEIVLDYGDAIYNINSSSLKTNILKLSELPSSFKKFTYKIELEPEYLLVSVNGCFNVYYLQINRFIDTIYAKANTSKDYWKYHFSDTLKKSHLDGWEELYGGEYGNSLNVAQGYIIEYYTWDPQAEITSNISKDEYHNRNFRIDKNDQEWYDEEYRQDGYEFCENPTDWSDYLSEEYVTLTESLKSSGSYRTLLTTNRDHYSIDMSITKDCKTFTQLYINDQLRVLKDKNKVIKTLAPQSSNIAYSGFLNKYPLLVTGNTNGEIILWNWKKKTTKDPLLTFLGSSSSLFAITPENYYMSLSPNSTELLFRKGATTFQFEQFDLKYNRPDLVLENIGIADQKLINAYRQAYLKRLKKMNFTEEMLEDDFHLPKIEIENFEEMPDIEDQGNIELKLNLEDSKYPLDRINIWVNDVSVYGADGISLRDKNIKEYSTTLSVNLANGKNKVQVSVLNQAGAESYKETFEIESNAGKIKPDLYLITIGESEFKQSEYNLTYAAKDANDMATLFQKSKVYGEVKTKTLTNEQASKANILDLKSFLADANINDQVMIFVAGHGVLDANLDYFFATYDMDFNNPSEKGLAYEDLESLLYGIAPLKKTLLIDACHSGEIDKDEMELAQNTATETSDVQFRSVGNTAQPKLGMQNTSELTKSLFTDLRKGTGATVISSAGGMEFAMESGKWKNGLFTYVLINGVESMKADINKDGEIWLSEIQEYVSKEVTKLSNGQQQPTSRIENQIVDFRVW